MGEDRDVEAVGPREAAGEQAQRDALSGAGSPATSAKPPWLTRWCSTRRQKLSTAGVVSRLSTGTSVAKGFHFSP